MASQLLRPLEQSVGALDAFQGNSAATDGDGRLTNVERTDSFCRRMCRLDIAPVRFSWHCLGQRPFGRDKPGHDLMRADNFDAARLQAAGQYLQQAVIAARKRHGDRGYQRQ